MNVLSQKNSKVGKNLTEGPILKSLLLFAIPIVLSSLVQQLYSMVDLAVIGQYVGLTGTVAVNTGSEFADLLSPVAMGFSTAGQIYISQLVGAKEDKKIKKTIGTLLTFMMVIAFLGMIISLLFAKPILALVNCPEEALSQAEWYMWIVSFGIPFVFGYNAVCGVLRGMGDSERPLRFIVVAALVNVVLDLLFVAVFKWDAAGTALATTISQSASFVSAFLHLWRNKEKFDFSLNREYFSIDFSILKILVKLGIPQVVRTTCVRTGMLWVNAQANSYGLVISGANSVGNKLQKLLDCFVSGVDTASAAMIGQNLGARKIERVKKITLYTVASCLVAASVSSIIALCFPKEIYRLFTRDVETIEVGVTFLKIFVLHFFASAVTGSFQALVTGCGFVELGFILGVLDGLVCKIGLCMFFMNVLNMGYIGLWWGVAASRIPNAFIVIGYYLSGSWAKRKLIQ